MSWRIEKLGSLCTVKTGKKDVNEGNAEGAYPFFTCAAKHTYSDTFSFDCEAILIAGNGAVGQTNYYNGKFEAYQRTYVLCDFVDILPQFLLYVLNGRLMNELSSKVLGNTIPYIKKGMLTDFEVPVPPLEIQKKIVKKLDAIFAEFNKATLSIEANVKNAEALFQSYLKEVFEDNSYEMVKLSSLTDDISDGDHQPPPKASTGVPFITISNVNKTTKEIDFSNTFKVSREYYDNLKSNRKPAKGDVLYTVTGSFGIPIHIRTDDEFCFQRHIGLIRPSAKVDSRWLYWVMSSPQVFQQAVDSATGAAQLTVSLKSLRNFVIPNMPLDIQIIVVQKIEELYQQTRLLADNYRKKSNSLRILKNSALQNIFGSQLVKI